MNNFKIIITADFNEESLKKSLKVESVSLETLPKIITDYLSEGKKDMSPLESVIVKQVNQDGNPI